MSPVTITTEKLLSDFPILSRTVHDRPLVYLDSAATTLKPRSVVGAVSNHLLLEASNVHRGIHYLSGAATTAFETARRKVQKFIGAEHESEIVFTRGTTDSINLVARSFGERFVRAGDEVLITEMEHHSNFVPWQMLCERAGAHLRVVRVRDDGTLDMDHLKTLLSSKTRIAAFVHASNVVATVNPIESIISLCHEVNCAVLIDAAQSVAHHPIDVKKLNCDFLVFSGHKMLGPTGVGVLYGQSKWLNEMPPVQGGGGMIRSVSIERTTFDDPPGRFEAGTPMIAEVIGLSAAIDYFNEVGLSQIESRERDLTQKLGRVIRDLPGVRVLGPSDKVRGPLFSFVIDKIHPEDIGSLVDLEGVAIRTGHHCAQPLMRRFGLVATLRASLAFYNSEQDIEKFQAAIQKALRMLE